ncbi:protein of unknown function [Ruminococcaceae bacterium BL-6]|nr:protein of unknown function [Ruminococcaceae bacterium BL-6]
MLRLTRVPRHSNSFLCSLFLSYSIRGILLFACGIFTKQKDAPYVGVPLFGGDDNEKSEPQLKGSDFELFGGDEGNRTPVRKPLTKAFYECSR